jgi:hypothetical protein
MVVRTIRYFINCCFVFSKTEPNKTKTNLNKPFAHPKNP